MSKAMKPFPQSKLNPSSGHGVAKAKGKAKMTVENKFNMAEPENSEEDRVEEILRKFDLEGKFGPCAGSTRLERWERAEKLGLKPPKHIKDTILHEIDAGNTKINNCIWHGRI